MSERRKIVTTSAVAVMVWLLAVHSLKAETKHVAVALNDHERLGQRFTAHAPFSTLWISAPSWNDNEGGFTLTLWDSPQRKKKFATQSFSDYADNARLEIIVSPPLPPGTYYWEISERTGKTKVGLWALQSDEKVEDCAYRDGKPDPNLRFVFGVDLPLAHMKKEWPNQAQLLAVLQSDASFDEKSQACKDLAVIGDRMAVPVLTRLLSDEKLSHMARYALEPMPDSAVDDALRDALGKLKGKPLIGVINSIAVRRDTSAVEPLRRLLQHADPHVGSAAAAALGVIATPEAAKVLEQSAESAPATIRPALYEARLNCADSLAAQGRRQEALRIYERLRSAQAPPAIRAAAVRGAILIRQTDAAPLLIEQLHNNDPAIFGVALWMVQRELPGAEITRVLASELPKLTAERQALLIQALGERRDPAALPTLLAAAKSQEKVIRLAALRALLLMGDASAIPVLIETLGSPDSETARAAQDALATLGVKETDAAVTAMLDSADQSRRLVAIELTARRRMTSAVQSLLKAAQDPEQIVRVAALKALEKLAGPEQMNDLLDLLVNAKTSQDMDHAGRTLGAACSKAANPDECAEKLDRVFSQASPAIKRVILRVLCAVGGSKALQTVCAAVNDPDAEVKATAIRVLGEWRTMDAAPSLLNLAKTLPDATDRLLSLRSYIRLAGNKEAPESHRLAVCKQAAALITRPDEKKLLLGMLGGIISMDAIEMATSYLDDKDVKEEAGATVLAIAVNVVRQRKISPTDHGLMEAIKKVAQAGVSPALTKRAEELLKPR